MNTVFQSYALFPFLDVADNVAFGLKYHRVSRSEIRHRVGEALELVRLNGYERRRPSALSGGQQQRVALARALVLRPACCCSTSPWERSMPSSGGSCRSSSRHCRSSSA